MIISRPIIWSTPKNTKFSLIKINDNIVMSNPKKNILNPFKICDLNVTSEYLVIEIPTKKRNKYKIIVWNTSQYIVPILIEIKSKIWEIS